MLYIIGLGLSDEQDITLKGLEAVERCDEVFLEGYTSLLSCINGVSALENLYGKAVIVADRKMVEEKADEIILGRARRGDVAFLVVGDPFGATTHTDLVIRAKKMGVEVKVIHNASVMNAVGVCLWLTVSARLSLSLFLQKHGGPIASTTEYKEIAPPDCTLSAY